MSSSPARERSILLDGLRGFALMGIIGANFYVLSLWIFMPPQLQEALPGARFDPVIHFLHTVFIEGKFYSIFSLLFGIGFGIFLEKGGAAVNRYLRRMILLVIIGALHLRFIWEGDILLLYAILGLLLPFFQKSGGRALLIMATVLVMLPIALDALTVYTNGEFRPAGNMQEIAMAATAEQGITEEGFSTFISDGGVHEFMRWQNMAWLWRVDHILSSNRIPKVLGLFLIGLWVARKGIHRDPQGHAGSLRKVLLAGVFVGLPFSLLMGFSEIEPVHLPEPGALVHTVAYAFGVIPLALAYASGIALFSRRRIIARCLHILAPAGRMALTNYLLQSVAGLALFTGMGMGLGARTAPLFLEIMAISVFIVQLIYSHLWMRHFRYGPMEWLWRSATYGRLMPMMKEKEVIQPRVNEPEPG